MLGKVYNRFVQSIKDATTVVLLQDGVSQDDVKFYTEIADVQFDDKEQIKTFKFVKPIHMHLFQMTMDLFIAVAKLEECYCTSFNNKSICMQPFVVFCSSVVFAKYLVGRLREVAE